MMIRHPVTGHTREVPDKDVDGWMTLGWQKATPRETGGDTADKKTDEKKGVTK